MAGFIGSALKFCGRNLQQQLSTFRSFHALPSSLPNTKVFNPPKTSSWSLNFVRTIIRNNFPRASESKRIKKLGWRAKLKTVNGRRQIMRRILKGRYFLTH